jgi:hypothetical protein
MQLKLEFNLFGLVVLYVVALIASFANYGCGIVAFVCITSLLLYALYLGVTGEEKPE